MRKAAEAGRLHLEGGLSGALIHFIEELRLSQLVLPRRNHG